MGCIEDLDNEEHPRNAAAIRTALMLGAEFIEHGEGWTVKGISAVSKTKTWPAFFYLITHGICINSMGHPVLCKDVIS